MKTQKGITLIALIITIIVMLILVGVSVSVALNTGLFTTAGGAAKNTQIAAEAETALSEGKIKIDGGTEEISIDEYVASLKGEDGEDGEDAKWTLTDEDENGLDVGDLVTYKEKDTEKFYVISVTGNTVAMLAAKNITTTGTLEQSDSVPTEVFSTANYWDPDNELSYPLANGKYPDLNDETTYPKGDATSIITVAKAYGESLGATGRLMTVEEVVELGGNISGDTGSTSDCPDFINSQNYWLGSAIDAGHAGLVVGEFNYIGFFRGEGFANNVGVRPVVEVSTSSIN